MSGSAAEPPALSSPSGILPAIPEQLPHLHDSLRATHDQLAEDLLRNVAHEKSQQAQPVILLALERKK
ncbi:MAG TPA: hypothetical protein VGG72_28835 [Bryobacteraceae bacterium]|jgi:hypothetical protein